MNPLEPVTLSVSLALLLGLSFGAGPCNIACLPYLGPVFMASREGARRPWRTLLPFSLGRLCGYALLGSAAGWAGLVVQDRIASPWMRWVLGGATVLVALSLLWRTRRRAGRCGRREPASPVALTARVACLETPRRRPEGAGVEGRVIAQSERSSVALAVDGTRDSPPLLPGALFVMGLGMALNPCGPLTTVIVAAAHTQSAISGLLLGLTFGVGAVLIPALVFAIGVAHFATQVRVHLGPWRAGLEGASIGLLLVMGTGTALGWTAP